MCELVLDIEKGRRTILWCTAVCCWSAGSSERVSMSIPSVVLQFWFFLGGEGERRVRRVCVALCIACYNGSSLRIVEFGWVGEHNPLLVMSLFCSSTGVCGGRIGADVGPCSNTYLHTTTSDNIITDEPRDWIKSLFSTGVIAGSLPSGFISRMFGIKNTISNSFFLSSCS